MRTPQPMRRMRYLIGELISQGLVPEDQRKMMVYADSWLADTGTLPRAVFGFSISSLDGVWMMWLTWMGNMPVFAIRAPLLSAPGPETVWIGPDLTPVVIQPRNPSLAEAVKALGHSK